MKIVLQVVKNASVIIEEKLYSSIEKGYLLLVSFKEGDNEEIAEKIQEQRPQSAAINKPNPPAWSVFGKNLNFFRKIFSPGGIFFVRAGYYG